MNIALALQKWGRAAPDQPAIAVGDSVWIAYRSLADRVARIAGGLLKRGLVPGDRVAILMKNVPQYFECLFACWHAGLVAVPVNAKLHPRESGYILEHCGASLCLASPGLTVEGVDPAGSVIEVPSRQYDALSTEDAIPIHPSQPETLGWLFYTSGTTGRPKGAMLSHRNLLTMCQCYLSDIDDLPPWKAMLHPAPLSHGSGLYALPHLIKGSCQVVPESAGFDPTEIFEMIAAWPGATFFAAPTMIRRLTTHREDRDTAALKTIIFGGAPMHVADVRAYLDRFGAKLAQIYGLGEAPMTITGIRPAIYADAEHPRWEERIASAGLPQTGVEVLTVNEDGDPVDPGQVGEIVTKSDSVMQGYWQDAEATRGVLRNGWLRTGDLGSIDEEGFLSLRDRSKDLIISGGTNIYPREVEEVLLRHPAVAEVSVIGRPDPEWGESVVAYVVLEPGHEPDPSALDQLCLDNMARFKRPKAYRFVDALPKNNYGKVLKTVLRTAESSGGGPYRP